MGPGDGASGLIPGPDHSFNLRGDIVSDDKTMDVWMLTHVRGPKREVLKARTKCNVSTRFGRELIQEGRAEPYEGQDDRSADDSQIPANFPGRAALVEAGFASLDEIPRDLEALDAIDGIGEATAEKIVEALEDLE